MKNELNPQQKAAVETDSPRALVIAGAGSGKTRVLIERIAHLVETRKVSPYEIMAFTFTRKAAGEINERLDERIGGAYKCTTGTMHSVALGMLFRFGDLIGLSPKLLTIYSEWESNELLKYIMAEFGIKLTKKEINNAFNYYYQTGIVPINLDPVYPVFNTFLARCRENNAMTYGMLLIEFNKLLDKIVDHVNFKYLLVDEIQDIDPLQWKIINKIYKLLKTELFVVGDIDQSIYEFRGAVPGYLVNRRGEFDVFQLPVNYRSDAHIIQYADNLISKNQNRITKSSVPFHHAIKPVQVLENTDSDKIVKLCKELLAKNPSQKIAILSRYHFLLKKLDRLLGEEYIEHKYIGKQMALSNSKEFRTLHAFLKLMVNPLDNFSFMLIKDYLGMSEREYLEIRGLENENASYGLAKGHFGVYMDTKSAPQIFYSKPEDAPDFISAIIRSEFPELDEDGYICEFIENWSQNNNGGIKEYLDWLATIDIQDEIKEDYDGIQLMTIHAAKGLEWPVVIVAGLNEGLMPSSKAKDISQIESERRLAYVAWTRAKNTLILTIRPETTEFHGKKTHNPISRFIKESFPIVL